MEFLKGVLQNLWKTQRPEAPKRAGSSNNAEDERSQKKWTFRVQNVPRDWDERKLQEFIEEQGGCAGTTHSLALEVRGHSCTATIAFNKIPLQLQKVGAEGNWNIPLPNTPNASSALPPLVLDRAFHGFTTLYAPPPEDHKVDVIAISGLGGHAFGSFKEKEGDHMWLRDSLPQHLTRDGKPISRVIVYGYESSLSRSQSFQNLEDLGSSLHNHLLRLRDSGRFRPIIFIAHSLGGLIVKQTLISVSNSKRDVDQMLMQAVYGIAFFGVPHSGMDISSLIPMVADQPNRFLLESISHINSQVLSIQNRQFSQALGLEGQSEIVYFYETHQSRTAIQVNGEWAMAGPLSVLVTPSSATHRESGPEHLCSIGRSHSEMVKFRYGDDQYEKVLTRIQDLVGRATQPRSPTLYQDEKLCLQSLSFKLMDIRAQGVDNPTAGTCEWLLRHDTYTSWITDGGLLWIKGNPGSGKSTLLKFALKKQEMVLAGQNNALTLSFFFHGRGDDELQKTPLGFYRSLLHQILRQVPAALVPLVEAFKLKCEQWLREWEWQLEDLRDFFKSSLPTILNTHSIWLFVDALDESGRENALSLSKEFDSLVLENPSPKLHICLTCRHYPILDAYDRPHICPENENTKDISKYIQSELSNPKLAKSSVPRLIMEKASGIFMWAQLVVRTTLQSQLDGVKPEEIAKKIMNVPPDLEGLYLRLVEEMGDKKDSLKLIRWVSFSKRSLTLGELRWAMAVEPDDPHQTLRSCRGSHNYIPDDDDFKLRVRALTCGLVEVAPSSDGPIVQFIHQSVKDFFIKKGLSVLDGGYSSTTGMANLQLAKICIRYMMIEEISEKINSACEGSGVVGTASQIHDALTSIASDFPLFRYAVASWITHTSRSDAKGISQSYLLDLFGWPSQHSIGRWANHDEDGSLLAIARSNTGSSLVHIASASGILGLLRTMLKHPDIKRRVDEADQRGCTPLSYAAQHGHEAAVKLLLSSKMVDPNAKANSGSPPLSFAASQGHEAVVELLLSTAAVNPDAKDSCGRTPLSFAAIRGHEAVVQKLVSSTRVDPDAKSGNGRTPLAYAARSGHKAVVKFLLSIEGVEPDSRDIKGRTPLSHAAEWGYLAVIKLLLATGRVNRYSVDCEGHSPMFYAGKSSGKGDWQGDPSAYTSSRIGLIQKLLA